MHQPQWSAACDAEHQPKQASCATSPSWSGEDEQAAMVKESVAAAVKTAPKPKSACRETRLTPMPRALRVLGRLATLTLKISRQQNSALELKKATHLFTRIP